MTSNGLKAFLVFVGYHDGGSSDLGSLLNLNAKALIGYRVSGCSHISQGASRFDLFNILKNDSTKWAGVGSLARSLISGMPTSPDLENQVIGEHCPGSATQLLAADLSLLDKMEDVLKVPVCMIHTVRNPYDQVADMYKVAGGSLEESVLRYMTVFQNVEKIRNFIDSDSWLRICYEDFIETPMTSMEAVCDFLELDADSEYLKACQAKCPQTPKLSRHDCEWDARALGQMNRLLMAFPYLRRYSFDA